MFPSFRSTNDVVFAIKDAIEELRINIDPAGFFKVHQHRVISTLKTFLPLFPAECGRRVEESNQRPLTLQRNMTAFPSAV